MDAWFGNKPAASRLVFLGVAQLGRALRLERRGRWSDPSHPDHIFPGSTTGSAFDC